jgi:hypothetical protein
VTTLERRCRLLLHAYPVAYRRDRAGEMLSTLLETTPAGRNWPLPRDSWALLLGGLQVRAGRERRLSTPGNLRLAALLGCTLFLSLTAVNYGSFGFGYYYNPTLGPALFLRWQPLTVMALILAAAVLPWLAGRAVVTLGALAAGAATVAYDLSSAFPWHDFHLPQQSPAAANATAIATLLLPLAALVLLARGRERPPRLWLWLPGLVIAFAVAADAHVVAEMLAGHPLITGSGPYPWLVPFGIAIAWIGIDARPAIGVASYFTLWLGQTLANRFGIGVWNFNWGVPDSANWWVTSANWWGQSWKWLAVVLVLAVLALRRVRRQAVV